MADDRIYGMGHTVVQPDKPKSNLPSVEARMIRAAHMDAELKMTIPKARVTKIVDGRTIMLETGQMVDLTGLYFSYNADGSDSDNLLMSYDFLEKNLKDRFVRVFQTRKDTIGRVNRYGHLLGHVVREDDIWVQGSLIASGLARVYPTETNPEMATQLYALEAEARKEAYGLWADKTLWRVMSAQETDMKKDAFQIVEGVITRVATVSNTIYLNFGEDWRSDFSIMIPQEKRPAFSRAGASPLNWSGRRVRVRGWVQDLNGPMIAVQHPIQIEFFDQAPDPAQQQE